jgi:hypothetical protein
MKVAIALLGILGLTLVGCSPTEPPQASIEKEASFNLPAWGEGKVLERKLSPINSIAGTTLPAGSWQIDVKLRVRTREALYLPMADHLRYAKLAASVGLETNPLNAFELWGWSRGSPPSTSVGKLRVRPSMHEFVYEAAPAGAEKEIWEKIIAEPLGSSEWKFTKARLEPLFNQGLPRNQFPPSLVFGSPEQVREQSVVQAAYDHEAEQRRLIDQLLPQVERLRTQGEAQLTEQYERAVDVRIARIVKRRYALMQDHDARVSKILAQGDAVHDNYVTRDRLMHAETARLTPLLDAFDAKYKSLDEERDSSSDRAKAETEKQIDDLVLNHGIDH